MGGGGWHKIIYEFVNDFVLSINNAESRLRNYYDYYDYYYYYYYYYY